VVYLCRLLCFVSQFPKSKEEVAAFKFFYSRKLNGSLVWKMEMRMWLAGCKRNGRTKSNVVVV
jgi:hypothetical protein